MRPTGERKRSPRKRAAVAAEGQPRPPQVRQLVVVTGLSGSGKVTALKALEDIGYYSVDNLPVDLIPKLAELAKDSPNILSAALGVDIREGQALERFPAIYSELGRVLPTSLIFMEADTSRGWRDFIPNLQIHCVAGTHTTMIQEPLVVDVARLLGEELRPL